MKILKTSHLTPTQRKVYECLIAGSKARDIAAALGITAHTVKCHVKMVYKKCDVHGQMELIQKALEPLAIFGRMMLDEHRESCSDLDGGWIQDKAIECGLLQEVSVTKPCGELCPCAEAGEFPQMCLRLTEAAKTVAVTEKTNV